MVVVSGVKIRTNGIVAAVERWDREGMMVVKRGSK